nr:uncharacterized protein LOC109158758 [Ipomoea batatas]
MPSSSFSRWNALWGLKIPPSWHNLLWRALALDVWQRSRLDVGNTNRESSASWLSDIFMQFTNDQIHVVAAVLMCLWHARNVAVWDGFVTRPEGVWRSAVSALQQWQSTHAALVTSGVIHASSMTHAPGDDMLTTSSLALCLDSSVRRPQLLSSYFHSSTGYSPFLLRGPCLRPDSGPSVHHSSIV